tara:strand:+ start:103513 stop:104262 length:750 start_codon:yes stop_codon:yes gene_type:complete
MPNPIRYDRLKSFNPLSEEIRENKIVGFQNTSAARPFSLLRTQFEKRLQANDWRVIGVTSATPGAGKSFLSANLAATLSRLPDRVTYLVDLDLRRGSVAENFALEEGLGISDYLNGNVDDLNQIGLRAEGTNLAIFPTLSGDYDTTSMLTGDRFSQLLASFRSLPDNAIIICDLPPVFANDDAMVIMQKLDAYLLVVEQGMTNERQVRDTVRMLEPAPCLGSVLNRYEGGFSDPYGYGYGAKYYSKYYS